MKIKIKNRKSGKNKGIKRKPLKIRVKAGKTLPYAKPSPTHGTALRDAAGRYLPGGPPRPPGPGRPKGSLNLTTTLKKILASQDSEGVSRGHKVMEALTEACERGETQAVKVVLDRIDGPVVAVNVNANAEFMSKISDTELDAILGTNEDADLFSTIGG